jgi:hypothetical protein
MIGTDLWHPCYDINFIQSAAEGVAKSLGDNAKHIEGYVRDTTSEGVLTMTLDSSLDPQLLRYLQAQEDKLRAEFNKKVDAVRAEGDAAAEEIRQLKKLLQRKSLFSMLFTSPSDDAVKKLISDL